MRNRYLILSVVVATLFACSSDSMSTDDMNKPGGVRATPINIKINKVEGTYNFNPVEDCQAVTLTATGDGIVSHLGPSSLIEQWCFDGNIGNLGNVGDRTITITAANGDLLEGTHTSVSYDPGIDPSVFVEEFMITGGTGRFSNASGTFTETVVISFPPVNGAGTFTLSGEGTIIYNTKD